MGGERLTDHARDFLPDLSPDPDTSKAAAGAAAPAGAPAPATPASAPTKGDLGAALVKLVDDNDATGAMSKVAASPKAGLDALESAGKLAAFMGLVKTAKPYSAVSRAHLAKIYTGSGSMARKRQVFESRFTVRITEDAGVTLTEAQLDTLHRQAILLPPAHVEGLSTFTQLRRTAGSGGSHGGSSVNMGDDSRGADAYSTTFRHEIGHAVDAKIGGPVETLRTVKAGWKKYASTQDFIDEVGGIKAADADQKKLVKDAFDHFTTSAQGSQAAPGKFEEILKSKVDGHYGSKAEDAKKAWSALNELWGKCAVMDTAKASYKGGYAHWNYQNFFVKGGRAYFCGHFYGQVLSMKSETHEDIKKWNNASAAFSDKEWFAEVYAEWYRTAKPGAGRTFPGFVQTFMRDVVAKLGEPPASAEGGGGNPKVAK